jgi:hypothetical protein
MTAVPSVINDAAWLGERAQLLASEGLPQVQVSRTDAPAARSLMACKDIDEVMAARRELVEALAQFEARLVKMAPNSEPLEE